MTTHINSDTPTNDAELAQHPPGTEYQSPAVAGDASPRGFNAMLGALQNAIAFDWEVDVTDQDVEADLAFGRD